jgi:hypothetical protein
MSPDLPPDLPGSPSEAGVLVEGAVQEKAFNARGWVVR